MTPGPEALPGRLRPLPVEAMDPEQRVLHAEICGGPRATGPQVFALTDADGALTGPFGAMLLQPQVGRALQSVGTALRYRGTLPDRSREVAVLVVAHAQDSAFEVYAHEAVGRAVGLTEAELAGLREGRHDVLSGDERAVAETALALATTGTLDDAAYARARDRLGEPGLFELTTLVGYYALLALQLRVFGVGVPPA